MAVEIKFGDHVKESFEICKANPVPTILTSVIAMVPMVVGSLVITALSFVGLPVFLLLLLMVPVYVIGIAASGVVTINWMAAIKAAKHEGKAIEIGQLTDTSNVVNKALALFFTMLGMCFCYVPGILIYFAPCIVADKPGTGAVQAVKGAFAFGKGNIVPLLILFIVVAIVQMVGAVACGVGVLFTGPLAAGAWFLAYDAHRASVEAAAAEGGVQLS